MSAFDTATALERTGPTSFVADVDRSWHVRRGANGGVVAAVLLRALLATVDDPARVPRSLTVHYAGPFDEGPTAIDTAIVRSGGSLTTARADATRDGAPIASALAAFSRPFRGVDFDDLPMPDVPAFDTLEPLVRVDQGPAIAQRFEYRMAFGGMPFSGADRAEAGAWLRLVDPVPLDYPLVAALTDAFFPVLLLTLSEPVACPTVDLTIHFRSTLAEAARRDTGPWFSVFRTRLVREGFMEEDGEIWTADGVLLAQSRQLALAVPL